MTPPTSPFTLHVLTGRLLVLFLLRVGGATPVLAVRPAQFLDGLLAARNLLSFSELQRDEPRLDELLPWAGNV